ncbi:hypothetical protein F3J24_17750 [Comamonas sp. Tr-654]|uniref:hypothetical protein n=1 Tax=Comamonas sp. Tr-654 TaxID=2608341 RepID=UPI00141DABB5|nr:hypothetical protein [Comamonas sp. Tr-654]NIF85358.1 hypothetical protein [Comamonas sp. Tr-654]
MAAGLRVKNDYGTFQINDTFPNFVLHSKQTVTPAQTSDQNIGLSELSVPAGAITAIRSTTPTCHLRASGTKLQLVQRPNLSGLGPVEVYIFHRQPNAPISGAGLRIRNAQGIIAFDSNYGPLKIIDVINGEGTFALPSSNVALIPVYQAKDTVDAWFGAQPNVYRGIGSQYAYTKFNGAQVEIGRTSLWAYYKSESANPNFPSMNGQYNNSQYLVVDTVGL